MTVWNSDIIALSSVYLTCFNIEYGYRQVLLYINNEMTITFLKREILFMLNVWNNLSLKAQATLLRQFAEL